MKAIARNILFQAAIWASFLAAGPAPEAASAQQVEVIASGTALRLDPDGASPVISTLSAGTVLEWVGESGPYYAVSVPGPPGQEALVGYILASEVSVAGMPRPSARTSGGGMAIPGVEAQYATAKQNRSAGTTKVAQGAALAAAAELSVSIMFEVEEREHYEDEAAYQTAQDRQATANSLKTVAVIGGAALAAYGIGRHVLGWRKMAALEREFPEATTPPLDRQYAEASLNRSLGRRKVFWGVFLAAASYATVEWVPYFSVPQSEDFEDPLEFRSAGNRRDKAETIRNWVGGAGGVLGVWGIAQWVLASQKMGEVEQLSRITALSIPMDSSGSESPVKLFVGRAGDRTQLGVAWSW